MLAGGGDLRKKMRQKKRVQEGRARLWVDADNASGQAVVQDGLARRLCVSIRSASVGGLALTWAEPQRVLGGS